MEILETSRTVQRLYKTDTRIEYSMIEYFELFLDYYNLDRVRIGSYKDHSRRPRQHLINYECFDDEELQVLNFLILKHGNIESAFREFINYDKHTN